MGLAKFIRTVLEERWDVLVNDSSREELLEFYMDLCTDDSKYDGPYDAELTLELDSDKVADWVFNELNDYSLIESGTSYTSFFHECLEDEIRRIIHDEPEEILDEFKNWFEHEFN